MSGPSSTSITFKGYAIGFILSAIFTLSAYFAAERQLWTETLLVPGLLILAAAQVAIQLICFLRLGKEERPKWNLIVFLFTVLVLAIVVIGTLWIMYNLSYRMTTLRT